MRFISNRDLDFMRNVFSQLINKFNDIHSIGDIKSN
jgi:hypothetical protein